MSSMKHDPQAIRNPAKSPIFKKHQQKDQIYKIQKEISERIYLDKDIFNLDIFNNISYLGGVYQ